MISIYLRALRKAGIVLLLGEVLVYFINQRHALKYIKYAMSIVYLFKYINIGQEGQVSLNLPLIAILILPLRDICDLITNR